MHRFSHNNDFGNQGFLNFIDRNISECNAMKASHILDSTGVRFFERQMLYWEQTRTYFLAELRLNFQIVQDDIDALYNKDRQVGGFDIQLRFPNNPDGFLSKLVYTINELKLIR